MNNSNDKSDNGNKIIYIYIYILEMLTFEYLIVTHKMQFKFY